MNKEATSTLIFARTLFRNFKKKFGIKQSDRRFHMYVIGKTGTGKTSLLETMAREDISAGRRLGLVDPHGDLAERLVEFARQARPKDLIYLDAANPECALRFNPLTGVALDRRPLMASGLVDAFRMLWEDSWGPRLEYILRNSLLTLLDQPEATLADIQKLMTDSDYRKSAAWRTTNSHVRSFWLTEFEKYSFRFKTEAIAPIQNKVGAFLTDPTLARLLTSPGPRLDLRRLIDSRCVFIINLCKGKIGPDAAGLLGALLVSMLGLAALSRADQEEEKRRDFHLYLDEFQTFTTPSLANMLSELRKYRLCLVLAHQYMTQLEPEVRDAILGNAGSVISFRLGFPDAERLADEFHPVFSATDIVSLPNYHIYLKLMIDGAVSKPFSAETIKIECGENG